MKNLNRISLKFVLICLQLAQVINETPQSYHFWVSDCIRAGCHVKTRLTSLISIPTWQPPTKRAKQTEIIHVSCQFCTLLSIVNHIPSISSVYFDNLRTVGNEPTITCDSCLSSQLVRKPESDGCNTRGGVGGPLIILHVQNTCKH